LWKAFATKAPFESNVLADWANDEFSAADLGGARLRSEYSTLEGAEEGSTGRSSKALPP
jgi:hypothetical protein